MRSYLVNHRDDEQAFPTHIDYRSHLGVEGTMADWESPEALRNPAERAKQND
ncbi:MAG: hypothetical protein ACK4QL_07755 [Pseudanabaenaceae cyanobacterium]